MSPAPGLQVKTLYRVAELSQMSDIPVRTMRRWVEQRGLAIRTGRSVMVPLVAFRDQFPQVWESIRISQSLRPGRCDACGGTVQP